jgi:hypothetical protein
MTKKAKPKDGAGKNSDTPPRWPADRVVRLKVADLVPYARNARMHTNAQVDQIAGAIKRFGFTNPVIVDERGEIVAGHGRVMAARRLALDEVPGIVIADGEWTEADRKAYRIWDNQSALLSEWSPEMLRVELSELKVGGYDLQLTGFDESSLVQFMANPNPRSPDEFKAVGEDIATEHSCPRCHFRWSGTADAAPRPAAANEEA